MQLPVHTEADKHVVRHPLLSGSDLLEDCLVLVRVFQTGIQRVVPAIVGLGEERIDIVGDLGFSEGIHHMSNLVLDAPSKKSVGIVRPGDCGRPAADHPRAGTVSDADMTSACIHEGVAEHPHIPDIVSRGRFFKVRFVDSVGPVHQLHQLFPRQAIIIEGIDTVRAKPGPYLAGWQRKQHMWESDLGRI